MLVYLFFLPLGIASLELPLAPFNVKVFCRQGRRYSRPAQTAVQCPSSSTACGYFEFSLPNKAGIDQTGIYDCVDSGILKNVDDSEEIDWDAAEDIPEDVLFPQLCGSQPTCSALHIDQLNPAFSRYLVTQYGIQLEKLRDGQIRFCCSLFHATLQKLVTSGADRLPSASASSMHCGGEICEAGAVGCLMHSVSSGDDEDYDDKKIKRRRRRQNADDFEIAPVEFSFDTFDYEEESLAIVTRAPSLPKNKTTQFLPSLNLPIVAPSPASTVKSVTKNGVKYAVIEEDDEEGDEEEELHCVYRHLNDEHYRWCLLVHQTKTGDRCYYHQGHTVCCCFAPPDTDTCDPTEMELVVPGKTERPAIIRVTPRPTTAFPIPPTTSAATTTSTSTSTSTSTTTSTTTTTTSTTTTTTPAPTPPPTTSAPRCRVTYTKTKGRRTPLLVCSSCLPKFFLSLVVILFVTNR